MQKWIMSGLMIFASLLAVFLLFSNLPSEEEGENHGEVISLPEVTVNEEAAMELYRNQCISCHGDQLQGGLGPGLNNIGAILTKEQIYDIISNGQGAMPAFGGSLSEEELLNVSTWLASLRG